MSFNARIDYQSSIYGGEVDSEIMRTINISNTPNWNLDKSTTSYTDCKIIDDDMSLSQAYYTDREERYNLDITQVLNFLEIMLEHIGKIRVKKNKYKNVCDGSSQCLKISVDDMILYSISASACDEIISFSEQERLYEFPSLYCSKPVSVSKKEKTRLIN
jgi:hypothetical protein